MRQAGGKSNKSSHGATPRNACTTGYGLGNMTFEEPQSQGTTGYAKRPAARVTGNARTVTTYTGYSRRYPSGVSRYSFNSGKKKPAVRDGTLSNSTKF